MATVNTAQQIINNCINSYLNYLKENCSLSESTLKKYDSVLKIILKDIDVPFFRIDSVMINSAISKAYKERNWTESHLGIVLNVVSGLFYWAKYLTDEPYTLKDMCIKNPITNEEDKRSTFISKLVQKAETTGIVEQYPIKKKDSNTVITKKNLINDNSITLNVMKYTEDEIILKRDIAIKSLLSSSNISASEISKLSIFDFLHTRIIIQSQNCRSLMRVILISNDTRNAIYDYLKTRKDSDEYLFESVYGEHTIEEREVFDISRK